MRLATEGNWIVLEVSDAGVGFDPGSVNGDAPTFGLLHLRERLAAVGGEIRIESKPGQGTRVTVRLPEEP
jgi:signal transduction histidine kinase